MRDTRLAALREAPDAFASSYEREAAYTEQRWRSWTQVSGNGVMYLAEVSGLPEIAGIAGVLVTGGAADLIAMWVRPVARGRKVGEALIEVTAGWAKSSGLDALSLWCTESNGPARQLYERCGFIGTGERQPLPSNPALSDIKMSRPL